MSDIETVRVKSVDVKAGDPPAKWVKYTLVDGNDRKMSTFDAKVGKFLQDHIGQQVDIVTKPSGENGKFTDLVSAVEHVETAKPAEKAGGWQPRDPESEQRIVREASLKAAVALHGPVAVVETLEKATKETIRIAAAFAQWVNTGITPELEQLIAKPTNGAAAIGKTAPVTPPQTTRGKLLADVVRAFNAEPAAAIKFLADKGWATTLTSLTDDQLHEVLAGLTESVPA